MPINRNQRERFTDFYKRFVGNDKSDVERALALIQYGIKRKSLQDSNEPEREALWNQLHHHYLHLRTFDAVKTDAEYIFSSAKFKPNDNVLSVGSGDAIIETYIAKNFTPDGKVTCVDISTKMNEAAERHKAAAGARNMEVLHGSSSNIRLANSSQDKIISAYSILAGRNIDLAIQEFRRLIRKNEKARLVLLDAVPNREAGELILRALQVSGFEVLTSQIKIHHGDTLFMIATAKPTLR